MQASHCVLSINILGIPSFFQHNFLKICQKPIDIGHRSVGNRFMFAKMYYLFSDSSKEIYWIVEWMCTVRTRYFVFLYVYCTMNGYGCFAVGCRLVPSVVGCQQCWTFSVAHKMDEWILDWVEQFGTANFPNGCSGSWENRKIQWKFLNLFRKLTIVYIRISGPTFNQFLFGFFFLLFSNEI